MSTRALIYGTIAIDTLITPAGQANSVLGGSGPYAALAARLLTPELDLYGVVGGDFPAAYRMALETRGVSLQHVACLPEEKTFAWTGRYEQDMNHRSTVSTLEGAQEHWQPDPPPALSRSGLVVAANVTPPLQYALIERCNPEAFVMADFMKSWIIREREYTQKLLARADLALMNDEEACEYARCDSPLAAGYALLEAGPAYAIVKHGSAGSTLFHRQAGGEVRLFRCPAWPLPHPEDPTGAGDAYMGALAGCLTHSLRGRSIAWEELTRAVAIATIVAGAVCEKFGTVSLFALTRTELARRISEFQQMTAWS
ncbi:MAG: hypothetical protein J1E42_07895 [Akkermansiaceae bacterium]|nr:hypothetical protein [Akkermansiaceae bacterium]